MNSIDQKDVALNQVDQFGFGTVNRKPSTDQQAGQNRAVANKGGNGSGLMGWSDDQIKAFQRKQIWTSIIVSIAVVFLFVMAIKNGWVKV